MHLNSIIKIPKVFCIFHPTTSCGILEQRVQGTLVASPQHKLSCALLFCGYLPPTDFMEIAPFLEGKIPQTGKVSKKEYLPGERYSFIVIEHSKNKIIALSRLFENEIGAGMLQSSDRQTFVLKDCQRYKVWATGFV